MKAPSKYERYILPNIEKIIGWIREGATDDDIAARLHTTRKTLHVYRKQYPEFAELFKENKEVVDTKVENALLKNALGYEYEECTYESAWNDSKKEFVEVCTKRVKKHQKPDTTAQIFWLKNRKPKEWRDTKEVKHEGSIKLEEFFKE